MAAINRVLPFLLSLYLCFGTHLLLTPVLCCINIVSLFLSARSYLRPLLKKNESLGVPIVAQWKQIRLGTMRLRVRSLPLLSGLTIRRCRELWCRLQTRLGSRVAVALA
uniref:Uncharacterized protein n=1 Tax=Sus scrofa TaxID=9823 RepID=A0A480HJX6_PIG